MTAKDCSNSATPQKKRSPWAIYKKQGIRPWLIVGLTISAPIALLSTSSLTQAASSLFTGTFESGIESGWRRELCCRQSAVTVSSPVRAGERAVKITLNKGDSDIQNSKRSELKLSPVPANSEQWYGFSMFLPESYKSDPSAEIIVQWHDKPDLDSGDIWKTPPLYLTTNNGDLLLRRRWDSRRIVKNNTPQGKEAINLGPYPKGVWTDFVFHVKWSYKSDGLLEVWRNGNLIVTEKGPNTYNDAVGPYFKMGIYKFDWKYNPGKSNTTQRVIYFDQVKAGGAGATYNQVAP